MINESDKRKYIKPAHYAPPFESIPFGKRGFRLACTLNPGGNSVFSTGKLLPYLHRTVRALREIVGTGNIEAFPEFSPTGKIHFHTFLNFYVRAKRFNGARPAVDDNCRSLMFICLYSVFCCKRCHL